jgi:YVTN family beta-propeller protein
MRRAYPLILVVLLLLAGCGRDRVQPPRRTATPSIPGVTVIPVGSLPCASAPGAGAMWVTNYGDGTLSRIDPATNRVTGTFPVGTNPCGVAYLDGHLWVALVSDEKVAEVDPMTGKVLHTTAIDGQVYDLQVGFGSVWVDDYGSHVIRIDPATGHVAATISVGSSAVLYGLAVTPQGVWAADTSGHRISRIDPATNRVVARIADPSGAPYTFAYTPGSLWVSSLPGATVRIDPATDKIVATVRYGAVTSGAPGDPDALGGTVWVPNSDDGVLAAVSPTTGAITVRVALGAGYEVAQAGFGSIWDCNFHGSSIARIDPARFVGAAD